MSNKYDGYTARVSNSPSYYGVVSLTEADVIAKNIAMMIKEEFPSIEVEIVTGDGVGVCKTTGPDEETIEEIDRWIQENWTAAL